MVHFHEGLFPTKAIQGLVDGVLGIPFSIVDIQNKPCIVGHLKIHRGLVWAFVEAISPGFPEARHPHRPLATRHLHHSVVVVVDDELLVGLPVVVQRVPVVAVVVDVEAKKEVND